MSKKLLIAMIALLIAVCGVSTYIHIKNKNESEENKKTYETVASEVAATADSVAPTATETPVNPYTDATQSGGSSGNYGGSQSYTNTMTSANNPDMVGWVKIDGTNIMNDGSMFANLELFRSKDFWSSHKTISFDTLDKKANYDILAVFAIPVDESDKNTFKFYEFVNSYDPDHFTTFVSKCKALSFYETGVSAKYGDKLLTLATCEYTHDIYKYIIGGKRSTIDNPTKNLD